MKGTATCLLAVMLAMPGTRSCPMTSRPHVRSLVLSRSLSLSLSLSLLCPPRATSRGAALEGGCKRPRRTRLLARSLSLSLNDLCPPRTTSRGAMLEGGCKRSRPWHPLDFPHHWPQAARLKEAARGLDPLDFRTMSHDPRLCERPWCMLQVVWSNAGCICDSTWPETSPAGADARNETRGRASAFSGDLGSKRSPAGPYSARPARR